MTGKPAGRGDRRGHGRHHGPPQGRRPGPAEHRSPADLDMVVLYGWHPVREALQNPARGLRRLLVTENALRRLEEERIDLRLAPEVVRPPAIDRLLTPDAVHQGFYLEADPLPAPAFGELKADDVVLVLDQITDPHNVGAIVRSAAAFAVAAIVTTERHSPAATGVLAKAASGGLEHVPIIYVKNLGEALEEMGASGVQRVGLDSEGAAVFERTALKGPLALVLGAEDKGLRARTRSLCDALVRLNMPGAIKSLNVSNAAALALYVARLSVKAG